MKHPSARALAMRDPALAVLSGAIDDSTDFGAEYGFDFAGGADYGFEFGDDAPAALPAPTPAQAMQAYRDLHMQKAHTQRRASLLEPNKGSAVKVEVYEFNVNQTLTLATALSFTATNQPDTNIRPKRISMNAPAPGFVTITELKVANVSVIVGGTSDAWNYNANGVGQHLDLPTLSPANRATIIGSYTAFVPPGFVGGSSYLFCVSMKGPASVIA